MCASLALRVTETAPERTSTCRTTLSCATTIAYEFPTTAPESKWIGEATHPDKVAQTPCNRLYEEADEIEECLIQRPGRTDVPSCPNEWMNALSAGKCAHNAHLRSLNSERR